MYVGVGDMIDGGKMYMRDDNNNNNEKGKERVNKLVDGRIFDMYGAIISGIWVGFFGTILF